jgi:flagellar hook-associated protein 2
VSTTPLTFTGVSTFSNDFQTIATRAQQISQIPVTQLQNKDSDTLQKKSLLAGLNSAVQGLSDSLAALGNTAAAKGLSAASSDSTVVTAANTGATNAATYTIDSVTSAATAAAERSLTFYGNTAAVSATGTVDLIVGGQTKTLTLTTNTLAGLRDQINGAGLGVNASILTAPTGNYLSVSVNTTGATTLRVVDHLDNTLNGPTADLLTATNQGTNAVFQLNGIAISQAGNVVNSVIPGVTFTIHGASAKAETITLATDRTKLSSALQDFVTNYNAVHTQLTAQIGPAAGLLSGDTLVSQVGDALRQVSSYRTSTGTVKSLADLGVSFSNTGVASFNQPTFDNLSDTQVSDGFAFVGSATQGLGGFSARLGQISDPIGGLIKIEQDGLDRTDKNLQTQINRLTDRITVTQAALAAKLHIADALLANLQSQQQVLSASLQGLNLVLYGKSPNQ